MESSDETSCSDCKLEFIQKTWTEILLKWLNKCVHPEKKIDILTPTCLSDIMTRYKIDICENDIDRAILCTDDIEPFIKYKYPILRLRNLDEASDYEKKQFIMTTVLLFHCCIRSQSGVVHADICKMMNQYEQEVILKFCERLDDMEITINNVECAVKEAFDYVKYVRNIFNTIEPSSSDGPQPSTDGSANLSSYAKLAQDSSKLLTSKFNTLTVLPSVVTDTSTYSDLADSETSVPQNHIFSDTDELSMYPIEKGRCCSRRSKVQIQIKQRAKNCQGPCSSSLNAPLNNKELNKGKPFYDPNSEAFEESRDEIIKEPKYKRATRKLLKDKHDDSIIIKEPHNRHSKKEKYLNETESIEEPKYKRSRREDVRHDNSISTKEPNYRHSKKEEYFNEPGSCLPGCPPRKLAQGTCPPACVFPKEIKCSDKDEIREYAETKHAVSDDRKSDQRSYFQGMKQGVEIDRDHQLEKVRYSLDTKQEQHRESSAKTKLNDENNEDKIEKKHEQDRESAKTKYSNAKDGDQIDKKKEQVKPSPDCSCKEKLKVSGFEKAGDQIDNNKPSSDCLCEAAKSSVSTVEIDGDKVKKTDEQNLDHCLAKCSCTKCKIGGARCGHPDNLQKVICGGDGSKEIGILANYKNRWANLSTKKKVLVIVEILVLIFVIVLASVIPFILTRNNAPEETETYKETREKLVQFSKYSYHEKHTWICKHNLCQKVYSFATENTFSSLSRCSLICMGPQLWPFPVGYTYFSKKIVALATKRLEYKFQSLPSEAVHQYLAEAFKFFIGDLARLERIDDDRNRKNISDDLTVKKMNIKIDVESDPDPRLRINTDESYHLKIETVNNQVVIKISSASFCGVRHGLQTLSQMILLDQCSGKLITLSNAVVKDAPIYKYRGLMIDTARNYIPVGDLMRNIDAMATVKLNTFHWRISDVTSFPLYLPKIPELFEYGAYDRSMIYTKDDVKHLVNRASVRGIRVLIEVAAPGPVGRAWSWHPEVSCPTKTANFTCNNILCLRLQLHESILDILETIYAEILEMTNIDDVFHLSDGIFAMSNCFYLIEDRQGFLDKALERLKRANKGFLPKLPIIWHTSHLIKDFEAKTWEQYGVQLTEMLHDPADVLLSKFRVIHSSKWDLSCEMNKNRCTKYRTWQEMYSWKSWRNIEVFTVEGGEAMLWTDLVNSGNLDNHIWPRAAAVAERLWSDTIVNATAGAPVYVRLDSQRWRMLINGVNVQPIWPLWCSLNPSKCLEKVR